MFAIRPFSQLQSIRSIFVNIEITDYKSFKAIRIRYINSYNIFTIRLINNFVCISSISFLMKTKQKAVANKLFIWFPL